MTVARGYVPQPGTVAARALAWFAAQPTGTSVPTAVLADALEVDTRGLTPCLERAVVGGVLVRERVDGLWRWRMSAAPRPAVEDPVDDDPDFREVRRTIDAAAAPVPPEIRVPASWIPPLEGIAIKHPAEPRPPTTTTGEGDGADAVPMAPRLAWREGKGARVAASRGAPAADDDAVQSDRPEEPAASPPPSQTASEPVPASASGAERQGSAPADLVGPGAATGVPRPFRCAVWSDGTLHLARGDADLVRLTRDETTTLLDYLDRVLRAEAA
ncbi:MAG: hypothetical protein ACTHL8_10260 [Burkholderiaceae bacterium]